MVSPFWKEPFVEQLCSCSSRIHFLKGIVHKTTACLAIVFCFVNDVLQQISYLLPLSPYLCFREQLALTRCSFLCRREPYFASHPRRHLLFDRNTITHAVTEACSRVQGYSCTLALASSLWPHTVFSTLRGIVVHRTLVAFTLLLSQRHHGFGSKT